MRIALCVVAAAAWVSAPAWSVEPLADDLCNFSVEGLSLASTPADAKRVFGSRGWSDESTPERMHYATRKPFREIYYVGSRTPAPSGASPALARSPIEYFKLTIMAGVSSGLVYRVAAPDAVARVQAVCDQIGSRFQSTNCRRTPRAVHGWGTVIQPFPGTLRQYCQLNVTYTESQPSLFEVKISRVEGTPPLLRAPSPGQMR